MRRAALAALTAALLSGTRTLAEPCAPAARLDGDDDVAARVAVELERLGVASTAAPGCPSLRAAVTRDPSGAIAVTIRDRADRIEGRVVGDELLAAIWIDSWLRDDVAAPVWKPRVVPAAAIAPPSMAPSRVPEVEAGAEPPVRVDDGFAVDAAYETSWTSDGASWTGVSAGACAKIGFACAGARVRAAWLPQITSSDGTAAASRSDLAAMAIATTSIEVGRMRVAPELGAGIGRMTTTRIDGCPPPPKCDPTTDPNNPMCTMPPPVCNDPTIQYVGDGFGATTWTPRLAASVRVALPLADHVWLEGTAAATLAPGGHGPFAGPYDAAGNAITIPGEPGASLALGVGLRVGAP